MTCESNNLYLKPYRKGKDEKLRLTNLEWGVDFLRLTNLVKTSLDGQIKVTFDKFDFLRMANFARTF